MRQLAADSADPRPEMARDGTQEDKVLRTVGRLRERLEGSADLDLLEDRVREFFARFETAPVQEFVPILVERELRKELLRPEGAA